MDDQTLRLRGDLYLDDALILSNLKLTLFEAVAPKSGLRSWAGCFLTKKNPMLDPEMAYRIKLADGRSSNISLVRVVSVKAGIFFIGFRAAGHLV